MLHHDPRGNDVNFNHQHRLVMDQLTKYGFLDIGKFLCRLGWITTSITMGWPKNVHKYQSQLFCLIYLNQPAANWLAEAALREILGLRYMHFLWLVCSNSGCHGELKLIVNCHNSRKKCCPKIDFFYFLLIHCFKMQGFFQIFHRNSYWIKK